MDSIFKTRALTEAVNALHPVPTTILDNVFARKSRQITDRFAWDVRTNSRKVLKSLKVSEEATVQNIQGRTTLTCEGPRFAEKALIKASDLNQLRAFGSQAGAQMLSDMVAENLLNLRGMIDRTREFMACKALTGTVVDADGTTLVTYSLGTGHSPVLAGVNKWDDDQANPLVNIRAWKKLIATDVGGTVDRFVAFCGTDAMDALLSSPAVAELMKYVSGSQIAEKGRIARLAEVDIVEYFGVYDNAGTITDMIAADKFVLVGVSDQNAAELFAPCVDLRDPEGVGSGKAAAMFFSKSWEQEDPSGRWIKVEARPLPVLYKPSCVVYADVL